MFKYYTLVAIILIFSSCKTGKNEMFPISQAPISDSLSEFSTIYTKPVRTKMYSTFVKDSFSIFQSAPSEYNKDSAKKYPLIILLDANLFFEPLLTEAKLLTGIGNIEESIVTGIAYKDLPTMDSIRSRDYTFPKAIPEYEMALSGGADHFKDFIDKEFLPKIEQDYKIDTQKIILCGHSLGGYFVLYYILKSAGDSTFPITNFVSASPSLHYDNRYVFQMEDSISKLQKSLPAKVYISMGSKDMGDKESKGILDAFNQQIMSHHYQGLQLRVEEFSNFGHLDAALPGFTKGLTFVFAK
jgi:predicted alpha/beta superfamily hydrolase